MKVFNPIDKSYEFLMFLLMAQLYLDTLCRSFFTLVVSNFYSSLARSFAQVTLQLKRSNIES